MNGKGRNDREEQNNDTEEIDTKREGLDGALPESNDTYDRGSKSIKFLYSVGRVTGQSVAATPSYMLAGFQPTGAGLSNSGFADVSAPNSLQLEVSMKARALKELEENLIFNGDSSSDATEFDGIVKLQGTTNQHDLSGAALTYDDIETAVEYAFEDSGRPSVAFGSIGAVRQVRKIMIDTFRYMPDKNQVDMPFGVPSMIVLETMIGSIPLIPSQYLVNTTGEKSIYFLDMDYIELRVLQDMTYEELAKTNDSRKFMLKIYECLIMRAPQFNSFIDNIE